MKISTLWGCYKGLQIAWISVRVHSVKNPIAGITQYIGVCRRSHNIWCVQEITQYMVCPIAGMTMRHSSYSSALLGLFLSVTRVIPQRYQDQCSGDIPIIPQHYVTESLKWYQFRREHNIKIQCPQIYQIANSSWDGATAKRIRGKTPSKISLSLVIKLFIHGTREKLNILKINHK